MNDSIWCANFVAFFAQPCYEIRQEDTNQQIQEKLKILNKQVEQLSNDQPKIYTTDDQVEKLTLTVLNFNLTMNHLNKRYIVLTKSIL